MISIVGDIFDSAKEAFKARDSDSFGFIILLVTAPITLPMANKGIDAYSEWASEANRTAIVGQCIEMSPLPKGKAIDYVKESGQVKVLQSEAGGRQSVAFMDFQTAMSLKVACDPGK
jgi:hypothetical protein